MSITAMWGLTHRDAIKRVFDRYGYTDALTDQNNPNRRRKQNIAQRLRLYRNDADYDLAGVIDALFVDENVRQQRKKLIPLAMYENVAKRIVDEVASLYNRPAVRTLTENNDAYRAICKEVDLDSAMKEAQRMLLLCNDVMLMLLKTPAGKHRMRVVTPDMFSAIPDENDRTELAAVLIDRKPESARIGMETNSSEVHYDLWDDIYRYQLSASGQIVKQEEHSLGRLPCVLMHAQKPSEHALLRADYGQDIISAHLAVFALNVMTLRLAKSQGERQPIFVGDAMQSASAQSADGERPVCLPPTSQAFMLDSKTSPEHYLMGKKEILSSVGRTYGMSYEMMTLTSDSSGKAVEQQRQKLIELRDEQRQRAVIHESMVCELLGFDPSTLTLDFSEQTIAMDAADEVALLSEKVRLGLDSPIKYLMRKDPDLDRDAAEETLNENIDDWARVVVLVRALNAPANGDVTEPGSDPHVNGVNNDGKPAIIPRADQQEGSQPQAKQQEAKPADADSTNQEKAPPVAAPQAALNGAQITSMIEVITSVSSGPISKDTARNILMLGFNLSEQDANSLL